MQATLKQILSHLDKGAFTNEAAISRQAVMPVLAELGWDIYDPEEVKPEYATSGRGRVEYALCLDGNPQIFVEVKQAGTFQKAAEQLLKYAFAEGIEMAVLTDARRWSVYLSTEPVPFEKRRVELLDIADRPLIEAATVLRRYLERDTTRSGANVRAAKEDLHNAVRRTKAADNIPDAWASLLTEHDGLISECLAERVKENTGVAPAEQDIRDYLDRVASALQGSKSISSPVQDASTPTCQEPLRSDALSAEQVFDAAAESGFHNVRSSTTTDTYKKRWLEFAEWCESNGYSWLPANPEHIVSWLEANNPRLAPRTLTHDLAAIKLAHEAHGQPNPVSRGSPPRQYLARLLKEKEIALRDSDQSPSWDQALPPHRYAP